MDVRVPDIGDFNDVPVIEILVAVGDTVAIEDPLVTLESDKATMDVPSPAAGTVTQLAVKVGDRVAEGSVVLSLDASGTEQEEGDGDAAGGEEPAPTEAPASEPQPLAPKPPETPVLASAGAGSSPPAAATDRDCDVLVLGAGPGGYTAAFRAADLGLRTVLVEREKTLGGVCLNVGCIPSKALLHAARTIAEAQEMAEHGVAFGAPKIDLAKLLAWKDEVVGKLTGGLSSMAKQRKVEVVTGEGELTGPHSLKVGDREITFESCIIAAGSQAVRLPMMPDDERVIDSTAALSPTDIPKRLLVVGGGIIGLEMATVYDALGSKVTVVEMLDQLMPGCDADLVKPLQKRIESRYEAILLKTSVTAVAAQKNGLKVSFSQGKDQIFDRILVAVGRLPNGKLIGAEAAGVTVDERGFIPVNAQMQTNVGSIYAIGDIVEGPMLAHKATHEAKVAAEAIAGLPGVAFDPAAIPSVAYTDPEVAWAGLTETAAKSAGTPYENAVFPWVASGRALGLGRPEGFTKLLVDPASKRLLGAGIVGVSAGDLITEAVLALEMGASAEDLALTIHPHPTLSESIGLAAELAEGTITDMLPPRKR
jgi:dihydrolipoamide dehydrogenase